MYLQIGIGYKVVFFNFYFLKNHEYHVIFKIHLLFVIMRTCPETQKRKMNDKKKFSLSKIYKKNSPMQEHLKSNQHNFSGNVLIIEKKCKC